MATVPSAGPTPKNSSCPYDFSRCCIEDSWKAAEYDCVLVSGSEHKCPSVPSGGVPFVPGKWYQFDEDLHCTNLLEPAGTITHQNIYRFDESLVSLLQPEIVMSLCDAEPGKSVDCPGQGPEATVKVRRYEPIVIKLLGGKYKVKQSADEFALHSTEPTDQFLGILPPQPKVIDLDDVVHSAGEKINQISQRIPPADDIES